LYGNVNLKVDFSMILDEGGKFPELGKIRRI